MSIELYKPLKPDGGFFPLKIFIKSCKVVFEKNIREKIISDCELFLGILRKDKPEENKPGFNWGSLVNAPNKLAGKLFRFKIYLNRDRCLKCGKCIRGCPHKVLKKDEESYPLPTKENCENCYRCVHN